MNIESATVLADEFPDLNGASLEAWFAYYNALRDRGIEHLDALNRVREGITTVYTLSYPRGRM